MKTFKLILKSLVSNNACITGGRKKPWYFAVIMFFLSMIFAILPLFVQTMNVKGDDTFENYSYGADVATLRFSEYLDHEGIKMYVKTSSEDTKFISCENAAGVETDVSFIHKDANGNDDFKFFFRSAQNEEEFNNLIGEEENSSYIFFYPEVVMVHIVNNDSKTLIKHLTCLEAAKYLDDGFSINSLLVKSDDKSQMVSETWGNWKLFIRDAYNFTRLTTVWQTVAIMGGINVAITVFMGLMIWILTRGKNNPYRLFNLWETQKMVWWAAITPSILTLGLGFLIPRFANILFPMLIGIRTMWLSMKSLRPDGTGYAESN